MRLHVLPTLNECIQQIDLDFESENGCRSHTVWVSAPDFPPHPLHAQLGWLHFQALVYAVQPAIGLCM